MRPSRECGLQLQPRRELERDNSRSVYGGSFTTFAEVAHRRLRDHGFDEVFQFLEDPTQQDERVTWTEYVEFEYWRLDGCTKAVQRYQKQHDAVRKKLVQSGILTDGGTADDFFNLEPLHQNKTDPSYIAPDEAIAQYKRLKRLYRTQRPTKPANVPWYNGL